MKKKLPDDPQSCGNCKFFLPNQHDPNGYCRRYPPVPLVDEEGISSVTAVTAAPEWCGEWLRKLDS